MSEARIHEQGYRRYEGDRLGVSAAMTGLVAHAVQRVLGLRRPFKSKLLPALVYLIAFTPAVVFVGLAALLGDTDVADEILPSYADYYGFILWGIVLFVAFVAPEVLCTDRNSGMLSLYLASPLTRDSYVVAKAAAVMIVILSVTTAPELLLLVAYTLEGAGPGGLVDFVELLGRILVAGVAAALLPVSLSLGISSLTKRREFASAGIVVALLGSVVVANALTDPEAADLHELFGLFDLLTLPFEAAVRVLEGRSDGGATSRLSAGWLVVGNLGWSMLFAALTRYRYQRVAVER